MSLFLFFLKLRFVTYQRRSLNLFSRLLLWSLTTYPTQTIGFLWDQKWKRNKKKEEEEIEEKDGEERKRIRGRRIKEEKGIKNDDFEKKILLKPMNQKKDQVTCLLLCSKMARQIKDQKERGRKEGEAMRKEGKAIGKKKSNCKEWLQPFDCVKY